ncbi:thioesterase domain-containing protein [Streptomyces sp. NPDC002044]|uniref:thioesterase II family protein n=1 Tax=Streptomyces sp. NPDC002044 TaxID=3154662 RepID=UPI00332485D4
MPAPTPPAPPTESGPAVRPTGQPEPGRWTVRLRPARHTAAARVVAFAHSGSGPNALLPLLRRLHPDAEVLGVTLPGRERRFTESCAGLPDDIDGALAAVLAELSAESPLPTVYFGHSMGAAFAAALVLAEPGLCHKLVLSGHPRLESRAGRAADWTEEDLLDVVRLGGGTPEEFLADPVIRDHLLHLLRCDLTLGRRLAERNAGRPLPVPPTVLGGLHDELVPPAELDRWAERGPLRRRLFPGGHFYLLDEANLDEVAAEITAGLLG